MKVRFDHLSLSAKDPEGMRDFFCELLDLTVGARPGFSFDGYFLFAGDEDVIHIFGNPADSEPNLLAAMGVAEQNIVHHVSFYSDDYDEVIERVTKLNLRYSIYEVPDSAVKQVFVRAPENLIIEIQAIPKER